MKKVNLIFTVLLCAALQFSCEKSEEKDGIVYSPNFIQVYLDAEGFKTEQTKLNNFTKPMFLVNLFGSDYTSKDSKGSDSFAKFSTIAKSNNDTNYQGELIPFINKAVNDSILGINIVCNQDFSQKYKQGSNVSDIVYFYGSTPYFFIQNGYNYTGLREDSEIESCFNYGYETIKCISSKIPTEQAKYFNPTCFFYFSELPENSGTYTFEVSIKLSEKTLKNTVTMNF